MKIGIMGAHGTGKTTLALQMASDRKQLHPEDQVGLLTEIARSCPFAINEAATPEAQSWIFHQQIIREIEENSRNSVLYCDRTVLDSLAYCYHAGFFGQARTLLPLALEHLDTYDELYFLRPNGAITSDGFRSTDPNFQRSIDRILSKWVETFNLRVTEVQNGSRDIA